MRFIYLWELAYDWSDYLLHFNHYVLSEIKKIFPKKKYLIQIIYDFAIPLPS